MHGQPLPQRPSFVVVAWLLLHLSALLPSARAAPPSPALLVQPENAMRDVREQAVSAMLLTRNGYLWLGTNLGLVRFDGVNFTNFGQEGADGATTDPIATGSMWEDGQGAVWAGTPDKGVLRYDHGQFFWLTQQGGLPANGIFRIDGDETGAVWIYTSRGLVRVRGERVDRVDPFQHGGTPGSPLQFGNPASPDTMHFGLWRRSLGGVERFAYGHWRPFPLPPGRAADFGRDLRNIYEDTLHRVWFALFSERGRYFCVDHGALRTFQAVPPDSFASYQDRSGSLWLTDHEGHTARWKDGITRSLAPVTTPGFLHVVERQDASFWVASGYSPLTLLRPRTITTLRTPGAPEVGAVLFRSRAGEVWAGGVGIERLLQDRLSPVLRGSPLRHFTFTRALGEDALGDLLYSARSVVQQLRLRGNTALSSPAYPGVRAHVEHLLLDHLGQEWLATDQGLLLLPAAEPLNAGRLVTTALVSCLLETSPGHIWAGSQTGPIEIQDGVIQTAAGPWTFGPVHAMAADKDGSLWIGTSNGLVLLRDRRVHAFSRADGLPTDLIGTVQTADPEALWLKTDASLLRVGRTSLEARLRDRSIGLSLRSFGTAEGLPSNRLSPFGNQGTLALPGGVLWFSTTGGIASLDPASMPRSVALPHALIEEHSIDRSGLQAGSPIVLQPGASSVEIHYTALGSDDPAELKFRYRLRGIDSAWVETGQRRVAYFTHLPPGTYSFEVQAANGDGDGWDQPGAATVLRVLAPWYRTLWFRSLLIGMVLAVLMLVLWRRQRRERAARQLRQAFTRRLLASQETERKRIAHDLHDSLGQHLALISNLAQPHRKSEISPWAKERFIQIQEEAGTALREVQHISYNLRPYQLDRLGLTNAVLSLVRGLEEATAVRVDCDVANIDNVFRKDLEINFYRIVQESLSNIARHSGAGSARVQVTCSELHVRLLIQDNGIGLSGAGSTTVSSLGLVGIAERAELLGGTAVIESDAGQGTTIVVQVDREVTATLKVGD